MGQRKCPSHLGKEGKSFFRKVIQEWELSDDLLKILVVTAERLDTYYKPKMVCDTEGLSYWSQTGQCRQRPEAQIAKESLAQFFQGCRLLHLDENEAEEKRPAHRPGHYGI